MEPLSTFAGVGAATELCVQIVSLCFVYSKDVKNAASEIDQLRRAVTNLQRLMESVEELRDRGNGMKLKDIGRLCDAINDARSLLQKLHDDLDPGKKRKAMSKIGFRSLKWPFQKENVRNRMVQLEQCIQAINLGLQLDQTTLLLDMDYRAVLDKLPVANGASFDSHDEADKPKCLADTRVGLLDDINKWADNPDSHSVFWLNGMAGTGKSTISRTLAESFANEKRLGASFFFKRGEADRTGSRKFFTTIAADLARRLPAYAPGLKEAIDADPDVLQRSSRDQFEVLVLGPLSKIPPESKIKDPIVIVIDALDECDQDEVGLLIRLMSRTKDLRFPRVKAFLTSRPELPLRLGFKEINGTYEDLILHEVPAPIIEHDISKFLETELSLIKKRYNLSVEDDRKLPDNWPGDDNIQTLVKMAVPLFIFASTVCRFIMDRKCGSPIRQLEVILQYQTKGQESQLHATYLPVLEQQVYELSTQQKELVVEEFRTIVGSIIILASPLPVPALSRLLRVDEGIVMDRLDMLHSVFSVPLSSVKGAVRLLHLSFRDFLLDPEIRDKTPLWIDEKQTHKKLAFHCLRVLDDFLKPDLCNVKVPGTPISEIDPATIEQHLPSEIQYACLHWVYHTQESGGELADNGEAHQFLLRHFLHWLEALSLMGRVRESIALIKSLQTLVEPILGAKLSNFLNDGWRFVLTHVSDVESWPLQIYNSALVFSPIGSVVRKNFQGDRPSWLALSPFVGRQWDSCLQVLEGHYGRVQYVAFSHDSKLVASASDDETIRIWVVDTGECIQELMGHSNSVNSVMFSHDSSLLVSGSDDETIRVWCAETGDCVRTLRGHVGNVLSAAFSHDSALIASGSEDGNVRIWETKTGDCVRMFSCDSEVNCVAFSHNSVLVASASDDGMVCLWKVDDGTCRQFLGQNRFLSSVTFSHDSSLVASVSHDGPIKIRRVDNGNCVREIMANRVGFTYSVTFSHDSAFVASVLDNDAVAIRRTDTGECVEILNGHNDCVRHVIFSHDSTRIASCSEDYTIRIWDSTMYTRNEPQNQPIHATTPDIWRGGSIGHNSAIEIMRLSPDSKLIASTAAWDKTIRIWSADTGHCIQEIMLPNSVTYLVFRRGSSHLLFRTDDQAVHFWEIDAGHFIYQLRPEAIGSWVFSPDLTLLASISKQEIQICNADTGSCVCTFANEGHVSECNTFSYDSKFFASMLTNGTIRLWDTETGNCSHQFLGHGTVNYKIMTFSHDSALVACASIGDDSTLHICVWSVDTSECVLDSSGKFTSLSYDFISSMAFNRDSSVLAVKTKAEILLCQIETGEIIQRINAGDFSEYFNFEAGTSRLLTDIGAYNIIKNRGKKDSTNGLYTRSGYGISIDGRWIMWGENNLLRLPLHFEAWNAAVLESGVVLGCESGRVLVFGMSTEVFPDF